MRRLEYSQIVRKKLKTLKNNLSETYGENFSMQKMTAIFGRLRQLEEYGESGVRIAEIYELETDYYYVFFEHNYFIYRLEGQKVIIVNMFHEKQDFMQKLFGISGRTKESIDFWGE